MPLPLGQSDRLRHLCSGGTRQFEYCSRKLQRTSLGSDIPGCEVQYRQVWRRLRGLQIDKLVRIADATPWSRGECWGEDTSSLEEALLRAALRVVLTFRLPLVTVPMLTSSHKDEGKGCYIIDAVAKAPFSHIELGRNRNANSVEKAGTAGLNTSWYM